MINLSLSFKITGVFDVAYFSNHVSRDKIEKLKFIDKTRKGTESAPRLLLDDARSSFGFSY